MSELKALPCPFSGSGEYIEVFQTASKAWKVVCTKSGCFCDGPYGNTKDEAVASWNRRSDDAGRLKDAVETIADALTKDPGYRISWQANIAVQFVDEMKRDAGSIHAAANRAADNFLRLLCSRAGNALPARPDNGERAVIEAAKECAPFLRECNDHHREDWKLTGYNKDCPGPGPLLRLEDALAALTPKGE